MKGITKIIGGLAIGTVNSALGAGGGMIAVPMARHDVPPDAVLAQAINAGSLTQLGGHALVELLHQEHAEGAEGLQAHNGQMGVVQMPRAHHHELGHHVGLPRHCDGGNVAEEERVFALELHLGKGVGCKGGSEQQAEYHYP